MFSASVLITCVAVVTGSVTQFKAAGYRNYRQDDTRQGGYHDPKYMIGEAIASEFDRHVPALSDNLRGELNTLRNEINRQFDSLKHHMDVKLDRMQRDAPSMPKAPREQAQETASSATPAATIRHNLAMAELRRLSSELTNTMHQEVARLRDEFRTSLTHLRQQVQNATDGLASTLGDEFSAQAEESTTMLKKVFFLTRNQMTLIQVQLSNISSAIKHAEPATLSPSTSNEGTPQTPSVTPSTATTFTHPVTTANTIAPTTLENSTVFTAAATSSITGSTIPTTTEFEVLPKDCMEAMTRGRLISGVTRIRASQDMPPQEVWCDQTTEGGGWTLMLSRRKQPIQLVFKRGWKAYAEGFGLADGEYWIGLETLYKLTKGNPYNLRVEMTWEDEEAVSLYDYFSVGPAWGQNRGYELSVGGYNKSSTGGDAMEYHSGMEFSTYDSDNDAADGGSCSEWSGGGGWWFNLCYYSNPTGIYPPSDLPPNTQVNHFLEWRKWQGYFTYLSSLRMMIRPN